MSANPMIWLNEQCQAIFRKNIETSLMKIEGPKHAPTITVEVTLPDGKSFIAAGENQKIARQAAAIKALNYLNNNKS